MVTVYWRTHGLFSDIVGSDHLLIWSSVDHICWSDDLLIRSSLNQIIYESYHLWIHLISLLIRSSVDQIICGFDHQWIRSPIGCRWIRSSVYEIICYCLWIRSSKDSLCIVEILVFECNSWFLPFVDSFWNRRRFFDALVRRIPSSVVFWTPHSRQTPDSLFRDRSV